MWRGLLVGQLGALLGTGDGRLGCVKGLGHLFADDVHEALEGLLHIDVVLGTRLEELKPWYREKQDKHRQMEKA